MNQESEEFSFEYLDLERPSISPWLLRVEMNAGESLQSLVARQCRYSEISLATLLKTLDVSDEYGYRPDLDIEPPKRLLKGLALGLSMAEAEISHGTLDKMLSVILSPSAQMTNLGHHWRARHIPWVLPNSWQYGRTTVGESIGGIPYCPLCFANSKDPWFPVQHRFSMVLTCQTHGLWLKDDCPRCGGPIGPMNLVKGGDWSLGESNDLCTTCTKREVASEAGETRPLMVERPTNAELEFQSMIRRAAMGEVVCVPQLGMMPAAQFLSGLRYVNTMAIYYSKRGVEPPRAGQRLGIPVPRLVPPSRFQPCLEFLPLEERRKRLTWFRWICEEPLDRWHILRKNITEPCSLNKSWEHPWVAVSMDGEYQKASTWQRGMRQRTGKANLSEVKGFFKVTKLIGLDDRAVSGLLGGKISIRECQVWSNIPSRRVPVECRHRMEHFMRIWDRLLKIYRDKEAARRWLLEPGEVEELEGRSPLRYLSKGEDNEGFDFISRVLLGK